MLTRRQFLKLGASIGAGLLLPVEWLGGHSSHLSAAGTPRLAKFVDQLIVPPVLNPTANPSYPGADYYEIFMKPGKWQFHRQLPVTASRDTTWGYGVPGGFFIGYLGPTIEAQSGKPVVVRWLNNLPTTPSHPLQASIDSTVPDPDSYPGLSDINGRAVAHLHGGFTESGSDGHPHSWWTADGQHGSHFFRPGGASNEAVFQYSNQQPAAPLWYHDHAFGITRLNVYAGLAALYFIRDQYDTGVPGTGLNLPTGPYEVPLVIQDKQFNLDGSLFYPTAGITAVHPIWVPEFFGDTPVVNGRAYPFLNVEPRRYRFRLVNGSQARFYNLWFDNPPSGATPFWVIGMEQGLLPAPVPLTRMLLAPGERADIIIDFANVPQGTILTLLNNAKAPYPGGRGGAINQIMQFRVVSPLQGTDTTTPPASLNLPSFAPLLPTATTPLREIVMKEDEDPATGQPIHMKLNGRWFGDCPIDETPQVGDTEVWQFINLTVDAHPMHMHLVKFQVVNRQPFDVTAYTAAWQAWIDGGRKSEAKPVLLNYVTGPVVPPAPEEGGYKDTAKSYPGQILRVIAKFDLPSALTLPPLPPDTPVEYVYHCHILEHEENEMMRPFQVLLAGGTAECTSPEAGTLTTQPAQSTQIAPTFQPPSK